MDYQIEHFAKESHIELFRFNNFSYPLHYHWAIEFIHLIEGELLINQPDKTEVLTAGQCALLLSNEIHGYQTTKQSTFDCLVFSPNWISPFLKQTKDLLPKTHVFTLSDLEKDYFKDMKYFLPNELKVQGFLLMICSSFQEQVIFHDQKITTNDLTTHLIDYIGRRYLEPLTLKQVAFDLGYDHFYLSHYFSKHMGISFHQYLTRLRLAHALDLLRTTEGKISDIALQSGFPSVRTFNTHFKREYQKTPRDYLS